MDPDRTSYKVPYYGQNLKKKKKKTKKINVWTYRDDQTKRSDPGRWRRAGNMQLLLQLQQLHDQYVKQADENNITYIFGHNARTACMKHCWSGHQYTSRQLVYYNRHQGRS
jgi:hypothetical protein